MARTRSRRHRHVAVALSAALLLVACGGDDTEEAAAPDGDDATEDEEMPAEEEEDAEEDMGEPVTLTLGHPFPAEHLIQVNMIEPWAEEVAEATDGTVTVEIHPGGALAAATDAYDNAASGAIDMGWALHGYTPGRFPLTDVVELPFQFDSAEQATNTLWDLYEEFPELQEEYGDVHVLALWTHDTGNFYTADQPVTEPDLSGLTLRAPGPIQTDVIEGMGGNAVGMPAPEIYDSLERGVIDGLVTADTAIESFTLHEVVGHATLMNFYVAGQFLVMNQDTWDSLSPAQQEAITAVSGREMSLVGATTYDEIHNEIIPRYESEWGIEVVEVEDLGPWEEAVQPAIDNWISAQEESGMPGQELYDRVQEIVGE
ncbi:MAG: TRAP transporter substrate-binding protein [Actinomycetota bacterium]